MNQQTLDQSFMRSAIELAGQAVGKVEPNPLVGCVIVRGEEIIGSGFHRAFGGPHAEIEALRNCVDPAGATVYVTLEPCCHHGKTPPCSEALIEAGIARVVIAMEDPFPQVAGRGIEQLRQAGIEIEMGVLREQARSLNAAYLKRVRSGTPWVIAKWAMTADGRIATVTGRSQWITGPAARQQVHELRRRVDAVIVGMGTVELDDPLLTARPAGTRVLTRIVFCRHRLPDPRSRLMQSVEETPVMLAVGPDVDQQRAAMLRSTGAELYVCDSGCPVAMVSEVLAELGKRQMTNVLVEGGGELIESFFRAGQIDEVHAYLGAKVFGGRQAPGPVAGAGVEQVDDAFELRLLSLDRFEDDVRAVYRKNDRPNRN